ncbi:MAG: PAS domain S-box protein, partial [Brevundimonas sp.]
MITLPTSERETHRVDMVRSFGLLDRPRPSQHDEIASLARELAATRWALVTLVDAERVWLSGGADYPGADTCRWSSFSTHVITNPHETTWIADAREDFRFSQALSVTGEPYLRFYAGAPILVNGHAVGTVCAFDQTPRAFDPVIARSLSRLASVVAEDLAARHREQALRSALVASADALIECDDRGAITDWSEGAGRLFGFSSAEALGRNIDIMVPPKQRALHDQAFQKWLASAALGGRRMELCACRKDGSLIDIEVWMSVAHVRGVPHIHANIRDISERAAQAEALRRATADAEAASAAKTIFLTNMSHELR